MQDKKMRVALQFNEYDFRHKKALEILRNRPRHMTELVVNAVLHYVTCPDAGNEMSKEWVRGIVKEELEGYQPAVQSQAGSKGKESVVPTVRDEDIADLGDVMGMFRRGE